MSVEVFRTNISDPNAADKVFKELTKEFARTKVNFDLEDRDHVLRMVSEYNEIDTEAVLCLVRSLGFKIELLE